MSLGTVQGQISPAKDEGFKGKRLVTCMGTYVIGAGTTGSFGIGATGFQIVAVADGRSPAMFNGRFKRIKCFVVANTRNAANVIATDIGTSVLSVLSIPAGQVGRFEVNNIDREFTLSQLIAWNFSGAGTGSMTIVITFELEFDFPVGEAGEDSLFVYGYDSFSTNVGTGNVNFTGNQNGNNSQVVGSTTRWKAPYDGEVLMYATWAVNDDAEPSTSQQRYQKNSVTEDFVLIIGHGASQAKFEQRRELSGETFLKGEYINFQVDMAGNGNYCMFFSLVRFDLF